MHNGVDVGPGAKNLAVDETLEIDALSARFDSVAVEVELQNVGCCDRARRHVARQQEAVCAVRMPGADVAERIHHALMEEDVVSIHKVGDELRIGGDEYGHAVAFERGAFFRMIALTRDRASIFRLSGDASQPLALPHAIVLYINSDMGDAGD